MITNVINVFNPFHLLLIALSMHRFVSHRAQSRTCVSRIREIDLFVSHQHFSIYQPNILPDIALLGHRTCGMHKPLKLR